MIIFESEDLEAWAIHTPIEGAGGRQNGVSDLFCLQPAAILPPKQVVVGVDCGSLFVVLRLLTVGCA